MFTTNRSSSSIHAAVPLLPKRVGCRRKPVRAVRPASYCVTAPDARGTSNRRAVPQVGFLASTLTDTPVRHLMYFPGRLTNDGRPEWYPDRAPAVRSIDGYGSERVQRPLATWDPEDFESDFDRFCESSVSVCAMADANRRRFPMRAVG